MKHPIKVLHEAPQTGRSVKTLYLGQQIYRPEHALTLVMSCSGENVEDAFLDTAKKIYQNIQDGRYLLTPELSLLAC